MKTLSKIVKTHQKRVHFFKVTLPILGGMLILLLLVWPQIIKQKNTISDLLKESTNFNRKANISMEGGRFLSEDKKGQPFSITAEKVFEKDTDTIRLKLPQSVLVLNSGVKIISNAPSADFIQKDNLILFTENLYFTSDNGYHGKLSDTTFNHKEKWAKSPKPISISGPKGYLNASAFKLRQNGDEIDFMAPVEFKFIQKGDIFLTAEEQIQVRQKDLTVTAIKNATLKDKENTLTADKIIFYYQRIAKKYQLKNITAVGNVILTTSSESISGDKADYDINKELATFTENVKIKRNEGDINGDIATVDLKTGISTLKSTNRIFGKIFPERIKDGS